MALGRVVLILFIPLLLCDAAALSLDLDGLKEQAATHITGQKLSEIVSTPSLLAGTSVSPGPFLKARVSVPIHHSCNIQRIQCDCVSITSRPRLKLGSPCCDAV